MPAIAIVGNQKASFLVGLAARFEQTPIPMPRQLKLGCGNEDRCVATLLREKLRTYCRHNPVLALDADALRFEPGMRSKRKRAGCASQYPASVDIIDMYSGHDHPVVCPYLAANVCGLRTG